MENKAKKKYSNYKQKSTDKWKPINTYQDNPKNRNISINLKEIDFNTVRWIQTNSGLKMLNLNDQPNVQNTHSPLHKDSMNSPHEEGEERHSATFSLGCPNNDGVFRSKTEWMHTKNNDKHNAYQKSMLGVDSHNTSDSTPSFWSISHNPSKGLDEVDHEEIGSIWGIKNQSFCDSTKLIINKELLDNIRQVSSQLLIIKDCFEKYKEYYKLDVLEKTIHIFKLIAPR